MRFSRVGDQTGANTHSRNEEEDQEHKGDLERMGLKFIKNLHLSPLNYNNHS